MKRAWLFLYFIFFVNPIKGFDFVDFDYSMKEGQFKLLLKDEKLSKLYVIFKKLYQKNKNRFVPLAQPSIPKLFHYIWLGSKLPEQFMPYLQSWVENHPNWILLWRSVDQYRFDGSIWTYNYKDFIFCDDKKCSYHSEFIHTPRTPPNLRGNVHVLKGYDYGMLHFQFVNWRNLLIKQAWYRCLERIRQPEKTDAEINERYAPSKDEQYLGVRDSYPEWFDCYSFFDPTVYDRPENWKEKLVLEWFEKYGENHFAGLDIWDIDWGKE